MCLDRASKCRKFSEVRCNNDLINHGSQPNGYRAADSINGRAFGKSGFGLCHRNASLASLTLLEQVQCRSSAEETTLSWKLSHALRVFGRTRLWMDSGRSLRCRIDEHDAVTHAKQAGKIKEEMIEWVPALRGQVSALRSKHPR